MFDSNRIVAAAAAVGFAAGALGTMAIMSIKSRLSEEENVYESRRLVDEYLSLHYGQNLPSPLLPPDSSATVADAAEFPTRIAQVCLEYCTQGQNVTVLNRALDIGCAVGRSSFELAKTFEHVTGLDYSSAFIDTCNKLKADKKLNYLLKIEGDITVDATAIVPSYVGNVTFTEGDACNLPKNLGKFGCVLGANLVCRLKKPRDFLRLLPNLVEMGGILVLASPYTWLTEFTDKKDWLGGYEENNHPVRGSNTLLEELGKDFQMVGNHNMPFLIRETERKYQYTVSHVTVWRRK